jgi:hypothetical protein
MHVREAVGTALLGLVLMNGGLIGSTQAQSHSGYRHWRGQHVVNVHRRSYRRRYYRHYGHRRIVIVGPSYWRNHRVVYVYRRPYYYCPYDSALLPTLKTSGQ